MSLGGCARTLQDPTLLFCSFRCPGLWFCGYWGFPFSGGREEGRGEGVSAGALTGCDLCSTLCWVPAACWWQSWGHTGSQVPGRHPSGPAGLCWAVWWGTPWLRLQRSKWPEAGRLRQRHPWEPRAEAPGPLHGQCLRVHFYGGPLKWMSFEPPQTLAPMDSGTVPTRGTSPPLTALLR